MLPVPRPRLAPVLLLPVLALAACGGGSGSAQPSTAGAVTASGPPSAQTATVVGGPDLKFAPETVQARTGTLALTMRIAGGVPHDLVFGDRSVGPDIPTTPSGSATGTYTFSRPGTYSFECTIHRGMVGQVVVG